LQERRNVFIFPSRVVKQDDRAGDCSIGEVVKIDRRGVAPGALGEKTL